MAKVENEKHFLAYIAQKALIENDKGQILLVQYPSDDHSAAGKWDLPGGRLNENETALEGLTREVFEEIGADIQVEGILATGAKEITPAFKLFFVIYKASLSHPEKALVAEEGEIGKIEWHDKADFFTLPIIGNGYQEALKDILV
jgi:8-oxo-dGTP pyrophosphatase MutT (NUDIX family)